MYIYKFVDVSLWASSFTNYLFFLLLNKVYRLIQTKDKNYNNNVRGKISLESLAEWCFPTDEQKNNQSESIRL